MAHPSVSSREPSPYRFFDAHCDTVMRVFDNGLDFVAGRGQAHVDLPRLLSAGHCVQLFAVFAVQSYHAGEDVTAYAEKALATIHGWVSSSEGRLRLATTAEDIRRATAGQEAAVYALLGLEGADPLAGRADNLAHFHGLGVRSLIPAWDDNAFSGSSMGSGGPLTAAGAELIERAEASRMMVDVSHLSDVAFEQVRRMTHRPFVASHSDCRSLSPSPRNLTDEQICGLAERGGVMGINLAADFLASDYHAQWEAVVAPARAAAKDLDAAARQQVRQTAGEKLAAIPLPPLDWVARHVRHAMAVGGEECVGLGGDLDGISFMPAGIVGAQSYPLLAESLVSAGFTSTQVEKVCWRNMARVFGEVLG